jgi:tetratricopeptide (TPR) repeat protein
MEYAATCFVIMPFGKKTVALTDGTAKEVDFDSIYEAVFEPAIRGVALPEPEAERLGLEHLVPRRTDRDFFAGLITQDMFDYIQFSRFALADVSGLNANVFYELGVRHATVEAGTGVFRQPGAPIPFDIRQVKVFDYRYEPQEEIERSRALVARVLRESLAHNRLDSPVQQTLRRQQGYGRDVRDLLQEAEDHIRGQNWVAAADRYRKAAGREPDDAILRFKLGLMCKNAGRWPEALAHFDAALALDPDYGEAHRERGIVQNKLLHDRDPNVTGEAALRRAVALNPGDFHALASLGGVLKREGRLEDALDCYRRAADVSQGHSYPLLNAVRIELLQHGRFELDDERHFQLSRARYRLEGQTCTQPPHDAPWCFFDLAEVHLYLGDEAAFLDGIRKGTYASDHRWQAQTFRESLRALKDAGLDLPGLDAGLRWLDAHVPRLPA